MLISLALKGIFAYPTLSAQANGIKMTQIKPESDRLMEKMKIARMTNNQALSQSIQRELVDLRSKHGIDTAQGLFNLLQMPLLITWFLSLRYVTNLPEIFP